MRNKFALLIISASLLAAAQDGPSTIAWKPKEGSEIKYKMTSRSTVGDQVADFNATITIKVESVKADKVTVLATTSNISLKVGEQDLGAMMGSMTPSVRTVTDLRGELLGRTVMGGGEEFDSPRMENALTFVYPDKPMKVGDTWTRETNAKSFLKVPAAKTVFTYLGKEKTDFGEAYKVKLDFKEIEGSMPMTISGTMWLSVEDGNQIKSEIKGSNVEVGPGIPPVEMTAKTERIK